MAILKQVDFEVPGFGEFDVSPVSVTSYTQAINELNPLAYWRLNESSGTTLADQAATHPLTLSGDYSLGQDGALATHHDDAVRFGTATKATASGPVLPTSASAAFSIVFWIRTEVPPAQWRTVLQQHKGTTTGSTAVLLRFNGLLRYQSIGEPVLDTTQTISTDWSMVALTRNTTGDVKWYIDGDLDTQSTGHTNAVYDTAFILAPLNANSTVFFLDEVAIFDDALPASQIQSLYELGTGYFF